MLSLIFRNSTSVILRRCSSGPQVKNSMDNQGRTVEAAVQEHGLHVIDDIKLEGVTGSIPSLRTDIDDIIKLKKTNPSLRLVVVPDTSRFTRVGAHHGQKLLYDLEAVGIFAYFVAEDIANDTHMSKMYLSFLFDSANQQAKSIARNGTIGSENSFLQGKSPHTRVTPYGLDRLYLVDDQPQHIIRNLPDGTQQMLDPETKAVTRTFGRNEKKGIPNHYIKQKSERILLIPGDPAFVAIVLMIFQLRYAGDRLSVHRIACILNDLGLPEPEGGEWSTGTVYNISVGAVYLGVGIRNKRATGIYSVSSGEGEPHPSKVTLEDLVRERPKPKLRVRSEWIERPQPLLVDFLPAEVRPAAQRAVESFHERTGTGKPIVPDNNKHAKTSPYILSKVMVSKQGQQPMTGQSKSGNGKKYRRYLVSRAKSSPKTNNVLSGTIPADAVEPAIMDIVRAVILEQDGLRQALFRAVEDAGQSRGDVVDVALISKDIAKRQKRIVSLSRRLADDAVIDAPLNAEMDRLQNEVRDLAAQLRFAQETQAPATVDPEVNVDALMAEFAAYVEGLQDNDPPAAKDLVRLLVGRMEADLVTKEVEIELSVPKSLGQLLCGPKPVCLVSAFACSDRHEAHHENRLKIELHRCELTTPRHPCYVCRREAA